MNHDRIQTLKHAINQAEANLRQAKLILNELESGKSKPLQSTPPVNEKPGVTGIYDGEKMTTATGETFPVPGNYASKSLLVVGDTLKMYEENGEKRFKQIEHVKRHKTTGLLVKKDGKFRAITPEGSYRVLSESINHFGGEVGDEVLLHLPAGNLTAPYGAIETIRKKSANAFAVEESVEAPVTAAPTVVDSKKPEPKKPIVRHHKPESKPVPKKPSPPKPVESPTVTKSEEKALEVPAATVESAVPGEEELS